MSPFRSLRGRTPCFTKSSRSHSDTVTGQNVGDGSEPSAPAPPATSSMVFVSSIRSLRLEAIDVKRLEARGKRGHGGSGMAEAAEEEVFFLQGKDLANANRTSEDYRRGRPPVYNLTMLGTEGAVSTFGNGSTRQASLCLLNACQTTVPQQKQSPRGVYGVTPSGAGIPHQPRPASSRVATPRGISFVTRHFMTRRIRSGAGTSRHPGSTLRVGRHPQ